MAAEREDEEAALGARAEAVWREEVLLRQAHDRGRYEGMQKGLLLSGAITYSFLLSLLIAQWLVAMTVRDATDSERMDEAAARGIAIGLVLFAIHYLTHLVCLCNAEFHRRRGWWEAQHLAQFSRLDKISLCVPCFFIALVFRSPTLFGVVALCWAICEADLYAWSLCERYTLYRTPPRGVLLAHFLFDIHGRRNNEEEEEEEERGARSAGRIKKKKNLLLLVGHKDKERLVRNDDRELDLERCAGLDGSAVVDW